MALRAGEMDERITLQTLTESQGSAGGVEESYSDLATVWAKVKRTTGNEDFSSAQWHDDQTWTFIIRYSSDVDSVSEGDRIVLGSETYNIRSIERMGLRKEALRIKAQREWQASAP